MEKGEKLLKVSEAAQRLSLSPWTLRGWIFRRKIDAVRLGSAVRIPEETIQRLIQEGFRPADK